MEGSQPESTIVKDLLKQATSVQQKDMGVAGRPYYFLAEKDGKKVFFSFAFEGHVIKDGDLKLMAVGLVLRFRMEGYGSTPVPAREEDDHDDGLLKKYFFPILLGPTNALHLHDAVVKWDVYNRLYDWIEERFTEKGWKLTTPKMDFHLIGMSEFSEMPEELPKQLQELTFPEW